MTFQKSGLWAFVQDWAWPMLVVALVLAKWLGLIGGLVALCVYFSLRRHVGVVRAAAASAMLALVAGVAIVALMNPV